MNTSNATGRQQNSGVALASRRQRYWDLRAAGNFIGGGSGTGLIVAAAVAATSGTPFRVPLLLGLALIAAGLTLVWLEIGKPWRALHVFFQPRTSWMTREGIVASVMIPFGVVAAAAANPALTWLTAVLAVGFLYCQARILRAARAIVAWRQKEIVGLILAAGLAEGFALALIVGLRGGIGLGLAVAAGLAREFAWHRYCAALRREPGAAASLAVFGAPVPRRLAFVQRVGLALIAAALIVSLAGVSGTAIDAASAVLAIGGGALLALTSWGMKALLITRAAFTGALIVPVTPIRGARPESAADGKAPALVQRHAR
ncbi:MAG: phenylacetyl-CoA:acceptor oxidoreductase [Acidobacteriia bacterium]|nr:phenylacetyl-CoA:acceptor oxidoreductase [Methyloceanibacter sp.]MBX5470889.1 phenylacetyl-CoA:acceptor oxidoreductase [Acetobacteraceae bacterium]MCL6491280.1 phenylacetyl-CoA:acceptor oxidoreductase [Terriglobia bacterium]